MITRKGRFLNESELSERIDPCFIIPGLEAGQVGILSAPGATGKTIFLSNWPFHLQADTDFSRRFLLRVLVVFCSLSLKKL